MGKPEQRVAATANTQDGRHGPCRPSPPWPFVWLQCTFRRRDPEDPDRGRGSQYSVPAVRENLERWEERHTLFRYHMVTHKMSVHNSGVVEIKEGTGAVMLW